MRAPESMTLRQDIQSSSERRGWRVVILLMLAGIAGQIDKSLLSLMVGPIQKDLAITDLQMSLLLGFAFAVFMAVASLPLAWLADRSDRRIILAIGVGAWSVMTALGAFTNDFTTLFITRAGVGVGEACLIPAGGALIADSFSRDRLARANSVFIVGGAFGAGLSLLVGGGIVQWVSSGAYGSIPGLGGFHGWQVALILAAAPGVVLAALIALMVRDPRTGAAGTAKARTDSVNETPSVGGAARSGGGNESIGEFFREHRTTLLTLWLAYPLASAAAQGWLGWIPAHLSRSFGLDPGHAAVYFGLLILTCGAGGTLLGGYITDVLFRRGNSDAALKISIFSFLCLALIGALTPLAGSLTAMLCLLGPFFLFAGLMAVMPTLAMQLITPPQYRARVIAGMLLAVTLIGGGLGPTAVALIERLLGSPHSMGVALALTAGVLCPISALLLHFARAPFARSLAATAGAPLRRESTE